MQPESPYKVEPHYAVNNMAEEGVQVAQNMQHVIEAVLDNTYEQLNALDDARTKMGSHLDGANIEAADTLRAYHPMVQKEILQSLRDEGSNDVLPTFQFSDDAGLPIGRATGLPLVKKSDYDKLKKIMNREGITPLDKAHHPNKR